MDSLSAQLERANAELRLRLAGGEQVIRGRAAGNPQ